MCYLRKSKDQKEKIKIDFLELVNFSSHRYRTLIANLSRSASSSRFREIGSPLIRTSQGRINPNSRFLDFNSSSSSLSTPLFGRIELLHL